MLSPLSVGVGPEKLLSPLGEGVGRGKVAVTTCCSCRPWNMCCSPHRLWLRCRRVEEVLQTKQRHQNGQAIYTFSKSRSHKKAYCCSKFNAYCLLSHRNNSTLILFYHCRPTVTLHQGQGHRHEHEHVCHATALPSVNVIA